MFVKERDDGLSEAGLRRIVLQLVLGEDISSWQIVFDKGKSRLLNGKTLEAGWVSAWVEQC